MLTPNSHGVFDRSGLACLSDLQTPLWHELFSALETKQAAFLAQEDRFRSPQYKWPRDALHDWSRVWEYPYVYYHLKSWRNKFARSPLPRVVDIGSAVTFFPFLVAELGYHVTCTDLDPTCGRDLQLATECVSHQPGCVDFCACSDSALPFADAEADILYCISVLEHIPMFESTVREMARILKPGGVLLLTIDLDLRGDAEIGIEKYDQLMDTLKTHFHQCLPDRTIHPADILHTTSGPYPRETLRGVRWAKFLVTQRIVKPLLGRKPSPIPPRRVAVLGSAFEKT